jgi:catechol 2,3-dioxygenase-like lactoylglutathione lyase family enzyme
VDMKLEVVVIPVSDVDRAKEFYERIGWRLDADVATGDDLRLIQLTPPGSGGSVQFGTNLTSAAPGSLQSTYLVVADIAATRDELAKAGVHVTDVFHCESGFACRFGGAEAPGRVDGRGPDDGSYSSFASFSDPDGNTWLLQEVTSRLPGRVDPLSTSYSSASDLAQALRRAAAAHGEHEARTGEADANWPDWYAEYMVREHAGEELPT